MRRFVMMSGGHNKFWEAELRTRNGATYLYRHWGKIGTNGQASEELQLSWHKAQQELDSLIEQKLAKGYGEVRTSESSHLGHPPRPDLTSKPLEKKFKPAEHGPAPKAEVFKPMSLDEIRQKFKGK